MSGWVVPTEIKQQIAAEFAAWLEGRNLVAKPMPGVEPDVAAQAVHDWTAGYRFAIRSLRELAGVYGMDDDARELDA